MLRVNFDTAEVYIKDVVVDAVCQTKAVYNAVSWKLQQDAMILAEQLTEQLKVKFTVKVI